MSSRSPSTLPPKTHAGDKKPYEPVPGQPGKDSVWVPTPFITLEKMYDLAKLTPKDFVMDLGSGDGRAIIVAAKRGTPGLGIEWNQDLVDLSNKLAAEAGVSHLAKFERGDMFAADLSKASVLGLFMLPDQLAKLTPKFLAHAAGLAHHDQRLRHSRLDHRRDREGDRRLRHLVHRASLHRAGAGRGHVAARRGRPRADAELPDAHRHAHRGRQGTPIAGRLNGEEITFTAGDAQYTGRVAGNAMSGQVNGKPWSAAKK